MITLIAPLVIKAIINSLIVGLLLWVALKIILPAIRQVAPFYKYHLSNIFLLIPLFVFIQPLSDILAVLNTSPLEISTSNTTTKQTIVTDDIAALSTTTTQSPAAPVALSPEYIYQQIGNTLAPYSDVIIWMYIIGLLLFSIRFLLSYRHSLQLKVKDTVPAIGHWNLLLTRACHSLNIRSDIKILFTKRNISPCIIGHAKAVILIPVSLANNLTNEQAEAIILHELAHHKQYDYYINLITQLINSILFFNPFTWLIAKEAAKQRELSCDAIATKHNRSFELAESLSIIAQQRMAHNRLTLGVKQSPLRTRIQKLLGVEEHSGTQKNLLLSIFTLTLATIILLISNGKLFSQKKDTLRDQLKEISVEMYAEGNEKYIFVDAVLDSLIILPGYYHIRYYNGIVTIYKQKSPFPISYSEDVVPIPDDINKRYAKKFRSFLLSQEESKERIYSIVYDRNYRSMLSLDSILNKSSEFRKVNLHDRNITGINTQAWKNVITSLYIDGYIADTAESLHFEYRKDTIAINDKHLKGNAYDKYERLLLEQFGARLDKKHTGGVTIGRWKKYLKLPDSYTKAYDKVIAKIKPARDTFNPIPIVMELHKDGLMDTTFETRLQFSGKGIYVNDVKLEGVYGKKYMHLYKKAMPSDRQPDNYVIKYKWIPKSLRNTTTKSSASINRVNVITKVNGNYIINEAVKDGLASFEDTIKVFFYEENVYINGRKLKDSLLLKYTKLYNELTKGVEDNDSPIYMLTKPPTVDEKTSSTNSLSMKKNNSTTITETNIPDGSYPIDKSGIGKVSKMDIINSMDRDGLVDLLNPIEIIYNADGVKVNGRQLQGDAEKTYLKLFKLYKGGIPKGSFEQYTITRQPAVISVSGNTKNSFRPSGMHYVAQEYYKHGYENFILVQALYDGIIKERENYNFTITKDDIRLNGKSLEEPYRTAYLAYLRDFYKAHNKNYPPSQSLRGDGVKWKDFGKQDSYLIKESVYEKADFNVQTAELLNILHKNKHLDTNMAYSMKYNHKGMKVNGVKLDDEIVEKYIQEVSLNTNMPPISSHINLTITHEP